MSMRRAVTELAAKFAASAREAEETGHHRKAADLYKAALIVLGGHEVQTTTDPAGTEQQSKEVDAT